MDTIEYLKQQVALFPVTELNSEIIYLQGVTVLTKNIEYSEVLLLNHCGINIISKVYLKDFNSLLNKKLKVADLNGYSIFEIDEAALYAILYLLDTLYNPYRGEYDMNAGEIFNILKEMDDEFSVKFKVDVKIKLLLIGGASILIGYGGTRQTMDLDFYEAYTTSRLSYLKNRFPIHFVDEEVLLLHPKATERMVKVEEIFKSFEIFLLSPIDLAISKIRRLEDKDLEDIKFLMENKYTDKDELFSSLNELKGKFPIGNLYKLEEYLK